MATPHRSNPSGIVSPRAYAAHGWPGSTCLSPRCLQTPGITTAPAAQPLSKRTLRKRFNKFTYNIGLDWTPAPGIMLYATNRSGYRAGGFNTRASTAVQLAPFKPETVNDVELGAKLDLAIGREVNVRTNIAL
ncbi:MAG: TonB-dependent receptor, partial [Sphingobium sp.]